MYIVHFKIKIICVTIAYCIFYCCNFNDWNKFII